MVEKTHRPVADPGLIAAIQARRRALAAGAAVPRRFIVPGAMTPRQPPAPPEPTAPTPPTPDPTPPDPTPTPDTLRTVGPFSEAAAERLYAQRAEVLRRVGVARVAAMDNATTGSEVPSLPVPTRSAPVGWPDAETVYARRREDVGRAQQRRGNTRL
jgi:hypothetical protein